LPLIVTHGWPGSITEQMKIVDPLTNPTAHGAERIGRFPCRDSVDTRLRFFRQADHDRVEPAHLPCVDGADEAPGIHGIRGASGDWGAVITELMGVQAPRNCSAFTPTCHVISTRHRQAGLFRRAGAGGSLGRREAGLRAAEFVYAKGIRLRLQMG